MKSLSSSSLSIVGVIALVCSIIIEHVVTADPIQLKPQQQQAATGAAEEQVAERTGFFERLTRPLMNYMLKDLEMCAKQQELKIETESFDQIWNAEQVCEKKCREAGSSYTSNSYKYAGSEVKCCCNSCVNKCN